MPLFILFDFKTGEFYYVKDIIILRHVMWLGSVNISMKIILTELRWYSVVQVKYGYWGDNWSLLAKHESKTLHYSFIPDAQHFFECVEGRSINWPLFHCNIYCPRGCKGVYCKDYHGTAFQYFMTWLCSRRGGLRVQHILRVQNKRFNDILLNSVAFFSALCLVLWSVNFNDTKDIGRSNLFHLMPL